MAASPRVAATDSFLDNNTVVNWLARVADENVNPSPQ
jgi:hypothetical protein